MSGNRFDSLLSQVQTRIEVLENTAKNFPTMSLDSKRQAMSRSKRDMTTLQNNLNEMARLIQTMPQRDKEFFQADLNESHDAFAEIQERYKAMDEELQRLIVEEREKPSEGLDADLVAENNAKAKNILADLNGTLAVGKDTIATQEHTKGTLAEDRVLLQHTSDNLFEIDNEAEKGYKAAGRMLMRGLMSKGITWGICVLLIIILGIILFLKLK